MDIQTRHFKQAHRKFPKPVAKARTETKVKGAKPAPMPDFIEPQLATLVKVAPTGKRWLHEIKLDGYRLQARIDKGKVRLLTRTGLDWTDRFGPDIVAALKALPTEAAILDGEVAVEGGSGATDFSLLQQDLSEDRDDRFTFYAFDLLYHDGQDLTRSPLLSRKGSLVEPACGCRQSPSLQRAFSPMKAGWC